MKERPILFSAPMVQAILAGNKTQTRRVMKGVGNDNCIDIVLPVEKHGVVRNYKCRNHVLDERTLNKCPYGQVGDQLWVRENFQLLFADEKTWDDMPYLNYKTGEGYAISYPATDGIVEFVNADGEVKDSITPSIYMPRWASRIQLEITNIRVERLHDISEANALAEGITYDRLPDNPQDSQRAKTWYMGLWEIINGAGSWNANPWVWVVEFKRIKP